MTTYLILIRGINVGGKNKVSMQLLKVMLERSGFKNVSTYINSGNVILDSPKNATYVRTSVEKILATSFQSDGEAIKVLALTYQQLNDVVSNKPAGFGDQPSLYHSDAIFLIDLNPDDAFGVFSPREGVDKVWLGKGVIYSQRLSALRAKSRLNRIIASPLYKSMTIRSWQTTTKLLELLEKRQ